MPTRSIDVIRDAIQQLHAAMDGFRTDAEPLAAAVQDYAAAVAEVNSRLRAAHALLRQGRRADAVHACDIEPNILECVSELDYSDQSLDAWLPTLEELGIPRPQRIQSDLASELSSAYDVGHQLASLMRQHRLLAIGRGALDERVHVLRRIIENDPENPAWPEDLAAYEAIFKSELSDELERLGRLPANSITQPIASRIKKLVRQLSSGDWLEPLDGSAVRRAQAVLNSVVRIRALAELDQLAGQLADAHATGNLSRAGELMERWYELGSHVTLPSDSPALERATRCLDWVTEERNRVATVLDAQHAADELRILAMQGAPTTPRAARTAADNLRAAVLRLQAIPASPGNADDHSLLLAEAADRLRRLQSVAHWFWTKIVIGGVVTIALVGLATAQAWRHSDRSRVVADVRKDVLDHWLANDKAAKSRAAWEKWCARYPWLDDDPIAAEMTTKVTKLEKQAADEECNAKRYVEDAASLIERQVTPQIVMVETFDAQAGDIQAILDARQFILSAIPRADAQLGRALKAIAFVRDQLGDTAANSLADELNRVQASLDDSKPRFDRQLRAVTTRVQDRINGDLAKLEEELMGPGSRVERDRVRARIDQFQTLDGKAATSLHDRLQKLVELEQRELAVKSLTADLDRAARDGLDDYLDAVAMKATDPGVGELAESLLKVAADRPAIEAAEKWSALTNAWGGNLSCDQTTAAKWRQALELAMDTEPRPACAEEETERLEQLLTCFKERDQREAPHVELLRQDLEQPVMQPGVLVVQGAKGRYYTRNPEMNGRKCFLTEEKLGRFLEAASEANTPAPQVALSKEILRSLDSIIAGRTIYEEGWIRILAMFDGKSQFRNCDPILQCMLINRVVDALKERAIFAESEPLLKLADRIADEVGRAPRWIDPENRDEDVALKAERIVTKTDLVASVIQDYGERRAALERRPLFSSRIIFHGWLDKQRGVDELRTHRDVRAADGVLCVVRTGKDGFELVGIGQNRGGKAILDHKPWLTFGQPVFLADFVDRPQGPE
jgi:hypothetical protein